MAARLLLVTHALEAYIGGRPVKQGCATSVPTPRPLGAQFDMTAKLLNLVRRDMRKLTSQITDSFRTDIRDHLRCIRESSQHRGYPNDTFLDSYLEGWQEHPYITPDNDGCESI